MSIIVLIVIIIIIIIIIIIAVIARSLVNVYGLYILPHSYVCKCLILKLRESLQKSLKTTFKKPLRKWKMILFERTSYHLSVNLLQQFSPRSQNRTQLLVFMCFGDKRRFGLGCGACGGVINPDFEREIRKRILPPRHPSSRWI